MPALKREKLKSYDAVVRTFNSARTLNSVLESLSRQTIPPERIIVIDSGSTDDTIAIAKVHGAEIVLYGEKPFNYSLALNLGIERVRAPACLVISSHVILLESDVTASLLEIISNESVAAAYVDWMKKTRVITFIDGTTFDGFNGLWNPCAMYRTEAVRQFLFDERVPSAEDQHLASRLFAAGFKTGVLEGPLISYQNPNQNSRQWRNAYVSVAYFSFRKKMSLVHIGQLVLEGLGFLCLFRLGPAYNRFVVAVRLVIAHFRRPKFPSRYFNISRKVNRPVAVIEGSKKTDSIDLKNI